MKKKMFVLGASDPEMEAIAAILEVNDLTVVRAMADGKPVHPGNANRADSTDKPIEDGMEVVFVECRIEGVEADIIVDHHNPGDPGYGFGPQYAVPASSLGQIVSLLAQEGQILGWSQGGYLPGEGRMEGEMVYSHLRESWLVRTPDGMLTLASDWVLTAAADHCLGAAYRGQVPGVDPADLAHWRATTRAAHQGVSPDEIREKVETAKRRLQSLPAVEFGGRRFLDARSDEIPELPEAAAQLGQAVVYRLLDKRSGRMKEGVLNGTPLDIRAWMETAPERGIEGVYGDPARGFAGGYLPA